MPESLRALFNIVSLTAAKTSRMFEVSVACVRLYTFVLASIAPCSSAGHSLRIEVQMCPVDLVEPPQ